MEGFAGVEAVEGRVAAADGGEITSVFILLAVSFDVEVEPAPAAIVTTRSATKA